MTQPMVLIANVGEPLSHELAVALTGYRTRTAQLCSAEELLATIRVEQPDLIVLGPLLDGRTSLELALRVRQVNRTMPLILLPCDSSEDLAIAAVQAGINGYLKAPPLPAEITEEVRRCLSRAGAEELRPQLQLHLVDEERMVGNSAPMQWLRARLRKIAASDSSLLVTGETGTGKELVAELVHRNSARRSRPFVSINCAAIPDSLLESELFGYERGAFTGADCAKQGRLKAAVGGTVFLDEIGDMTQYAQAKLLRVLETKQLEPLGSTRNVPVDVRFVAATNRDIEQLVKEDKFRSDLFFRLNVVRVHLPPLRERKEDIPFLLHHYIRVLQTKAEQPVERITDEALDCLLAHDWPGNVRELKNLLESLFAESCSPEITPSHLPLQFRARRTDTDGVPVTEKDRLLHALASSNWNKSKVAVRLKWSRMTVYRKMAKYQISDALNNRVAG